MNKTEFLEMMSEYKRIVSEHESMMKQNAKNMFLELSKEIFEKNPELKSFAWSQYTPYFNDGDSCNFSVNRDDYTINESEDTIDSWSLNNEKSREYIDIEEIGFTSFESLKSAYTDIDDLIQMFTDEDLEEMFGDHAQVTVTRDSIEIHDYDHD